jgi:GNAT superfamily N-acetyltransferase
VSDPRVRRATERDLPAMLTLKYRAGLAAWQHILPLEVLRGLGMPERWLAAVRVPGPRQSVLVADLEGEVVGFAVTGHSGDADAAPGLGELDGFYTDPEVWGRGVGRALLGAATASLAAAGFDAATLWTATRNHRPRRIYERAGWQTDGVTRRRTFGGTEFAEVRYWRALVGG